MDLVKSQNNKNEPNNRMMNKSSDVQEWVRLEELNHAKICS